MALLVVADCLHGEPVATRKLRLGQTQPPTNRPHILSRRRRNNSLRPGQLAGGKIGAVSGSAATCFAISRSVVAATRCQSTFERSRSALVRRTIGIALSPVSHAQTDDPSSGTAIGVDANQNLTCRATDCLYSPFAIVTPSVRALQCRSVEQGHCDLERQPSRPGVGEALHLIPFKDHPRI